jgi:hypothetical protein
MSSFERLKAEILADKKKVIILGSLGALAVALGARAMLSGDKRPSSGARVATVSTATASSYAAAASTIDAESRFRTIAASLPALAQASRSERDIFSLNTEHFPQPVETQPPETPDAKSEPQSDDDAKRREAIARDAESIRLKSTLIGDRPVAVIDLGGITGSRDLLVRVGDTVSGFVVVSIESKRVILERDGERIERTVRSPID